jgi:predicted nucleic acid-binding protein
VILLDAQGLVALLANEPAADEVDSILTSSGAGITPINLAEAIDISERVMGIDIAVVRPAITQLRSSVLHVLPSSEDDAWRAGRLRARSYHRTHAAISIADAFLVAAARPGDSVASGDAGVIAVARSEGLDVIPLPDSTGRMPA